MTIQAGKIVMTHFQKATGMRLLGKCDCGNSWPCPIAYDEAIARRDAGPGQTVLGDAVLIARGRPGPPSEPIRFTNDGEVNAK